MAQEKKEKEAQREAKKKRKEARRKEKVDRLRIEAATKKERILKGSINSSRRKAEVDPIEQSSLSRSGKVSLRRGESDSTQGGRVGKVLGPIQEEPSPRKRKDDHVKEKGTQTEAEDWPELARSESPRARVKDSSTQWDSTNQERSTLKAPAGSSTQASKSQSKRSSEVGQGRQKQGAKILENTRDRLKKALKSCIGGGCLGGGPATPRRLRRRSTQ